MELATGDTIEVTTQNKKTIKVKFDFDAKMVKQSFP
jgi:hypothetical protein